MWVPWRVSVGKLTCGYGPKWLTPSLMGTKKRVTTSAIPSAPQIVGASKNIFARQSHGDRVIFESAIICFCFSQGFLDSNGMASLTDWHLGCLSYHILNKKILQFDTSSFRCVETWYWLSLKNHSLSICHFSYLRFLSQSKYLKVIPALARMGSHRRWRLRSCQRKRLGNSTTFNKSSIFTAPCWRATGFLWINSWLNKFNVTSPIKSVKSSFRFLLIESPESVRFFWLFIHTLSKR